jgi:hypothetical protein
MFYLFLRLQVVWFFLHAGKELKDLLQQLGHCNYELVV